MFLGFHDSNKLSIYETGASRTYFSFSLDEVDFESLHDQTMAFTVRERSDIRHLQCIFTANQKTLDTIYEFLSSYTTANSMVNVMNHFQSMFSICSIGFLRHWLFIISASTLQDYES